MKKIIKYSALLIFLLLNCHLSISQNFSLQSFVFTKVGWVNVTEEIFESFRIPSEKIEVFDTRNKDLLILSLDSVLARIFIDKSGKSYFWVNCSYGREKFTSKIFSSTFKKEPTFSSKTCVITDSTSLAKEEEFFKEVVSKFSADFIVKPTYTIDPINGKEFSIYGFDVEERTLITGRNNIVLKDVVSGKEVLISGKDQAVSGLNNLLVWLYETKTTKEGLEYFLLENGKGGGIGSNVYFLKSYFEINIPEALKNLPNYKPMDNGTFISISEAIKRFGVETKKVSSKSSSEEKRITIK